MASPVFKIDGNTIDPQPNEIDVTEVEAAVEQMVDGSYVASSRAFGAVIKVKWGGDVASGTALSALRTARGGLLAHDIEFVDKASVTQTYNVIWPSEPSYKMMFGDIMSSIPVTFFERGA